MSTWSQLFGMPLVLGQESLHALGVFAGKPCSHSPQTFSSSASSPPESCMLNSKMWTPWFGPWRMWYLNTEVWDELWGIYRILVFLVGYSVLSHLRSLRVWSPALCILLWVSLCHCHASKGYWKCSSRIIFWQLCIVAEEPCRFSLTLHGEYRKEKK